MTQAHDRALQRLETEFTVEHHGSATFLLEGERVKVMGSPGLIASILLGQPDAYAERMGARRVRVSDPEAWAMIQRHARARLDEGRAAASEATS